jgi:hypothetical protein
MPLCHDGLCKSEPGESIPIFVRRLVATSQSPMQQGAKKPKALWFVQGGPSMPSTGRTLALACPFSLIYWPPTSLSFRIGRCYSRSAHVCCL